MTKQQELERYLREKKDSIVSLIPALHKAKALYAKLPDMYRQIAALQREIDELKKR